MKIVDKMGMPIEEGAVLYRLDDQMKYKVTRVVPPTPLNTGSITYELVTMLPEQTEDDKDKAMVASNFIRLYEAPKPRVM